MHLYKIQFPERRNIYKQTEINANVHKIPKYIKTRRKNHKCNEMLVEVKVL
jgi:hypothetical protein